MRSGTVRVRSNDAACSSQKRSSWARAFGARCGVVQSVEQTFTFPPSARRNAPCGSRCTHAGGPGDASAQSVKQVSPDAHVGHSVGAGDCEVEGVEQLAITAESVKTRARAISDLDLPSRCPMGDPSACAKCMPRS